MKKKEIVKIQPDPNFVYVYKYNFSEQQKKLIEFVKDQHNNFSKTDKKSVRKYSIDNETGYGTPYWSHVISVAERVSVYEPEGIEIALGHDLFEDTWCNYDKLHKALIEFKYSSQKANIICMGVKALTDVYESVDYPELNRASRKDLEAKRLGQIEPLYQSVKYCDLYDNSENIIECDEGFARKYLIEKLVMLNEMRRGDINLFVDCSWILKQGMDKLGINSWKTKS